MSEGEEYRIDALTRYLGGAPLVLASTPRQKRRTIARNRARHLRPSSRRHTVKRVKQPVRKTVESIEATRWWMCPKCETGPARRVEVSREGGFFQEVTFACRCGDTKWEDSTAAQRLYVQINKRS